MSHIPAAFCLLSICEIQWRKTIDAEALTGTCKLSLCSCIVTYRRFNLAKTDAAIWQTIDIRDYVNGIGNRSREPYIRVCTQCYSLHPVVRRC